MKSALYSRVPTSEQTTENHRRELTEACQKHGWDIVQVFEGAGVRGTKGRDARPAFSALCKAVARREVDIVEAWSVERGPDRTIAAGLETQPLKVLRPAFALVALALQDRRGFPGIQS